MSAQTEKTQIEANDPMSSCSYKEHSYTLSKSTFEEVLELVKRHGYTPCAIDLFVKASQIAKRSEALDDAINDFVDCRNAYLKDVEDLPGQFSNATVNSHE